MAEIHAGTAASVDRAVFPLKGNTLATARLNRSPAPSVVVQLAQGLVGRFFHCGEAPVLS